MEVSEPTHRYKMTVISLFRLPKFTRSFKYYQKNRKMW